MSLRQYLSRVTAALRGKDAGFPGLSEHFQGWPWIHALDEEINNAQAACKVATVYACLSRISQDLAGLPIRVYRVQGDKWLDVPDTHEIPLLLEYGNPTQTGYEVLRDWAAFWDTTGDAALFMARGKSRKLKPYEIWSVPGHLLHEVPGERRSVVEYEYLPTQERFPADNFATLRHWNPSVNPLEPSPRGMSPLTPAQADYETLYRQRLWVRKFFSVGGRTAAAFKPLDKERRLSADDVKAFQEKFMSLYGGLKNMDRPMVLDGMEPVPLGLTMQEMQYDAVAKAADLAVCRVLSVPPLMLGIKEGGGLSDAGSSADLLLYADNCIRPRATMISAVLTKHLAKLWGPEFRVYLDVDSMMAVQRAKLEQAKGLKELAGVSLISPDEAREQLDYDPLPNGLGKGLWVPFNVVPAEIAAEPPEPAPVVSPGAPKETPEEAKARRLAASNSDPKAQLRRWKDSDLGRYERRVGLWARTRFGRQEDAAVARLGDGVRASRLLRAAYNASDLLPASDDFTEAQRMFEALIAERGEAAAAEVGAEVVLHVHQGNLSHLIQNRAAKMVTQIDDTTRQELADILTDLSAEGASFDDLVKAVRQVFSGRRNNAATIARTETAWAYNLASKEAWSEAGVKWVSWLTVGDDVVRDSCREAEADGVLKMGEMFSNGLAFPGDPSANDPSLVINCFPPDAVMQGTIVAASRFRYVGPMLEVSTRSGLRLSVTPNHPVLTPDGFVPAYALREGDNVIRYGGEVEEPALGSVLNDEQAPSRIEDVFDAVRAAGCCASGEVRADDFDGDGAFGKGNVQVVSADRILLLNREAALAQDGGEGVLIGSAMGESLPASSGALQPVLDGVLHAATPDPSPAYLPDNSGRIELDLAPLQPLRIGPAAKIDASRFEGSGQRTATDAAFIAQLFERGAGQVAFDEVIEVRNRHFDGHVYDLQSDKGWIVADGIVSRNCRCVLQPEMVEETDLARMFDRRATPRMSLADLFETANGNGVSH